MASDQLKHMNELSMSETFAPLPLEIDMTKSPTAGAEPAVARTVTPLLTPDSGRAEDARQAGTESLNGNGFYRFQIGDFQATVISDDHGDFPVWPTFVMNISEAELAPVLHVLSPGPIKTPLVERQSPETIARMLATIPMGRMGERDEVAKAALFLASDDSSFVTGIELFVDGGRGQV